MSRIGKLPILTPAGVTVSVSDKNHVVVTGPMGELMLSVDPDIAIAQGEDGWEVTRPTDQKRHRALHGLTRSLVANMIEGVSNGYKKELEVIGVGYRAEVTNGILEMALGFTHPIYFLPPDGIDVSATTVRGQNPRVVIEGIDKQLVGQVAAKLRALRPPEPYKGKGIRYSDEFVRRKAGKTAAR